MLRALRGGGKGASARGTSPAAPKSSSKVQQAAGSSTNGHGNKRSFFSRKKSHSSSMVLAVAAKTQVEEAKKMLACLQVLKSKQLEIDQERIDQVCRHVAIAQKLSEQASASMTRRSSFSGTGSVVKAR